MASKKSSDKDQSRAFLEAEQAINNIRADKAKQAQIWAILDVNEDGTCSAKEVEALVAKNWPIMNHKPCLTAAYRRTVSAEGDCNGIMEKKDLNNLLKFLVMFTMLRRSYCEWAPDGRMGVDQWAQALESPNIMTLELDLKKGREEAKKDFKTMDLDHGGTVTFDEFTEWYLWKKGYKVKGRKQIAAAPKANRIDKRDYKDEEEWMKVKVDNWANCKKDQYDPVPLPKTVKKRSPDHSESDSDFVNSRGFPMSAHALNQSKSSSTPVQKESDDGWNVGWQSGAQEQKQQELEQFVTDKDAVKEKKVTKRK